MFISNVKKLSTRKNFTPDRNFIKKQQLNAILKILGKERPNKRLMAEALDIILDRWPFKNRRLRNLLNG